MIASPKVAMAYHAITGLLPHQAAGLVSVRRPRQTGLVVGVYRSDEAGIETDPDGKWATICEAHGTLICHRTRVLAEAHASDPLGWCEYCRDRSRPAVAALAAEVDS